MPLWRALCHDSALLNLSPDVFRRATFAGWASHVTSGRWLAHPHTALMARECDRIIHAALTGQPCQDLMINLPPGHGKSEVASILAPLRALERSPDLRVIAATYSLTLSQRFGRRTASLLRDGRIGIATSHSRMDLLETPSGGGVLFCSVGSTVTGFHGNLIIVDDLYPGIAAAYSETYKQNLIEWYDSVLSTRALAGARWIVVGTRWAEDDMFARLLERDPARWRHIVLPGLCESPKSDPLARDEGAPLCEAMRSRAEYEAMRAANAWTFSATQQQRPIAPEGMLFKPEWFTVEQIAPPDVWARCRFWDLAATLARPGADPDWTVGALVALRRDRTFIVENIVRFRDTPAGVTRRMQEIAMQDGRQVIIGFEQDPGQAGVDQADRLRRSFLGCRVEITRPVESKEHRARSLASGMESGRVRFLNAEWLPELRRELLAFPAGAHDDQVDAVNNAFVLLLDKFKVH